MKLQIKVDDKSCICEAKFKTFGCGSAIASSSYVTELVKGKTVAEAYEIQNTQIVTELSLPPVKIHCSVLAEYAIKAAVADWRPARRLSGKWRAKDARFRLRQGDVAYRGAQGAWANRRTDPCFWSSSLERVPICPVQEGARWSVIVSYCKVIVWLL